MKLDKRWLAAGLIVLAIAVPLTVKRLSGKSGTPVDVIVAAEQEVKPSILASGTLAYKVEVNLTAEVTARVRSIAVQEGDTVQEGQLLLRLDPETYNAIIAREEASVRQNRINIDRQRAVVALRKQQYERSQKLATAKLIDQNRLDEDRNQFVVAEADLRSSEEALQRSLAVLSDAREQRSKTEIRAPIGGRIVSLPIKAGEVAIPSTASLAGAQLMKIADVSAIQAEVKVDEADVAKITLGQRADVFAAAYPDTALVGKVERIALTPTVEGQGRSYKVTLAIEAPGTLQLRSGMSARAIIFLGDGRKQLSVPVEAVVTETPEKNVVKKFVWVDDGGTARKRAITTGLSDDRWEAIDSGIAVEDRVITGPAKTLRRLRDGDSVTERKNKPTNNEEGTDGDE
ncbi:MAG: efflux RND transporter periplasmic adaptor subunit [Acidibacter sp.]|jgi:HlyD family secretion protein|nr:efflux RND transporter periplasmic adaptor subunit [Acidibacter sp.]